MITLKAYSLEPLFNFQVEQIFQRCETLKDFLLTA